MSATVAADLENALNELGRLADADLPIVKTLLLMGQSDRGDEDIKAYEAHIGAMRDALTQEIGKHPIDAGQDVLKYRLQRLNAVIRDEFGYEEDKTSFAAMETINLLTVIDRRKGIPVALGSLYMDLATSQGWTVMGLNFPGHFLIRLDSGAQRMIVDPYEGKALDAGGMRRLVKRNIGEDAELSHSYYDTVTPREVVIRFYNNKKTRLIADGQYKDALHTTRLIHKIAPAEPRLDFDSGVLSIKLGHLKDATEYLEKFILVSKDKRSLAEAKSMLNDLRTKLQ